MLAGAYVFEITRAEGGVQFIDWRATTASHSFWLLVVVLLTMGLYGWGVSRFESRARRSLATDADIRQRVVEDLLPTLIEAVRKDIEAGKVKTMEDAMRIVSLPNGTRR